MKCGICGEAEAVECGLCDLCLHHLEDYRGSAEKWYEIIEDC